MIEAVLFDIYGTLIHIKTDEQDLETYRCLSKWLSYHGISVQPAELKELYLRTVNKMLQETGEKYPEVDLTNVFRRMFIARASESQLDKSLLEMAVTTFRSCSRRHIDVYPNVKETLEKLKRKNYKLGIVSNAQKVFTMPELRMFNLEKYFEKIVISSDFGFKKPDPRLFKIALDALKVKPSESVFVGNDAVDVEGAQKVGMKAIFLETGYGRKECKPDFIVADVNQILEIVESMKSIGH